MIPRAGVLVLCLVIAVRGEQSVSFLSEGTSKLAVSLLESLSAQEDPENRTNLVFSPLGYSVTLALLTEGSRGTTRNQISSFLHFPEDTYAARTTYKAVLSLMQEKFTLNQPEFKNWFYIYKNWTIEDAYRTVLEEYYLTQVKEVDRDPELEEPEEEPQSNKPLEEVDLRGEGTTVPAEQNDARSAVEKEIMSSLSANRLSSSEDNSTEEESKMIVFNALYFRGRWAGRFKEAKFDFQLGDGATKSVESIQAVGDFEYGRLRQLKATAINIPYEGERYSLLLVLPDRGESLASVIKKLPKLSLTTVDGQLTKREVNVTIPKFKFYTITRPKESLQKAGIEDVFSPQADLSGINNQKGLYLGDLVQIVTIRVSEESAAYNFLTTSNVGNFRTSNAEFIAQRPFLYFLRDRIDNFIVVAGKVEDPTDIS